MKVGFSTGFAELQNYWGRWPWTKQMGGSETIVHEVATALAYLGHSVQVRLPYELGEVEWKGTRVSDPVMYRGVQYVGSEYPAQKYHVLFCVDDYERKDTAERTVLVACRSDPPRHENFDERVYLSKTHARLMGDPDAPYIGGGVWLNAHADPVPAVSRVPKRVIYTSSPDRGGHHAAAIGKDFDYVATYRGANELDRRDLRRLQRTAMVQIHPCDPRRPSEFFCLSILEAMAAGTPCVISDADALPELWGEAAVVLPRPIDYSAWWQQVDTLIEDSDIWADASVAGLALASERDWLTVAKRYLEAAHA